jgi:periplasmic mercuric ion binding protein
LINGLSIISFFLYQNLYIMKTIKIFSILLISCLSVSSFAQKTKTETIKVSGNCGMCKTKIEKAAKSAGASYAVWSEESKELTVKYNSTSTNTAKIQQAVANTGYDTQDFKATEATYNSLHACCKYERATEVKAAASCCSKDGQNAKMTCNDSAKKDGAAMDCCKDGKCTMEGHDGKDCCKKDGSAKMDCCKDGKCTMEGHDGKDCCKKEGSAKMDCCKDGKCTMEGHDGKECCKKS